MPGLRAVWGPARLAGATIPVSASEFVARSWSLLGEHRRAAECAEAALRAFQERAPRSAQFNQVHTAEAYLGMGELEQALDCARAAIPMVRGLSSARSIEFIQGFADRLELYGTTVAVREFRDHLRSELAA